MKKTILATTLLAVLSTSAMASVIPGHTSDNVNRGHRHNEKAQNAWNVHTDGRISGNKAEADSNKDGIDWNSKRIADNNKFDDAQVNTNIKDRKAQEANAKGVAGNTAKEAADHAKDSAGIAGNTAKEAADHAKDSAGIAGNSTYGHANRGMINANTSAIAQNRGMISKNASDIKDNSKAIALNTALAGLKYHGSSIAMAIGTNNGHQAIAMGTSYAFTEAFSKLTVGAAYNGYS